MKTGQHWRDWIHDPGGAEGGVAQGAASVTTREADTAQLDMLPAAGPLHEGRCVQRRGAMEVDAGGEVDEEVADAAPRRSKGKRQWVMSVQPDLKRRAGCRACREAIDAGEVRFTPASKVSTRS